MQVISVVQEKGGAGKTTLVCVLASLMAQDGARVALIDTDPQRHLESWAEKSTIGIDYLYVENDEKLFPTVQHLKGEEYSYDVIMIDTAGFKSAIAMHAIAAADLVLIPSKANEGDAKGALNTYSHVNSVATAMNKVLQAFVVMVDIDANTNITHAVLSALDGAGVPRLRSMLYHRTGFKEMGSTGQGPSGSAKASAFEVLADLQSRGALAYYGGRDAKA